MCVSVLNVWMLCVCVGVKCLDVVCVWVLNYQDVVCVCGC